MPSVTEIMSKPAGELDLEDLLDVIHLEAPETDTLELKADLSLQKDVHGWRVKKELHRQESKSLAKEVVALANTYGGRIFVGISESKDMPRRAHELASPLPAVHELVERLRDSLSALIEPPIPGLTILPIPVAAKSSDGYVVLDVPRSRMGPHGFGSPPECYWRRDSVSRPMSMSDLQNAFWEARTRRERIDTEIATAEKRLAEMIDSTSDTFGFRITAISENPLEMRDLVSGLRSGDVYSPLEHNYFGVVTHPMYHNHNWMFSYFGASKRENTSEPHGVAEWRIDEVGVIELLGYFFPRDSSEIIMDVEAICGSAAHALRLAGAVERYSRGGNGRWITSIEFNSGYRKAAVKDPTIASKTVPVPFRRSATIRPLIIDQTRSPETTFAMLEDKVWAAFGLPVVNQRRYKLNL
ncbi:ATPase/AAA domain-containing protein [Rhizobium etli]|uniref:ATPase/AAA domain-containing protein n=2 Tax=Rhizobium etli TaxID=29449 RepID=A0AAN1EID7_RHIET|nr:ATPase/AAA domain-containing protein [Rhizobium etli]